jgi:HSP20 family molecular chaperone IbpA
MQTDTQLQSPDQTAGAERPANAVFTPEANIVETAEGYSVDVYMPGISEHTAEVTLENDVLTVRGRVDRAAPANLRPVYQEYEIGDYRRVFTLTDHIDRANVSATVRDGVLHLVLPKSESSKPKRIAVKAA